MDANQVLDRFLAAIAADPETSMVATMVAPYRALAGSPDAVVTTLDKLTAMWQEARA